MADIKNLNHFIEITTRNGFYLPKKSGLTIEYLTKLLDGEIWVPNFSDVRLAPCPRPPKRELILSEVERLLAEQGKPPLTLPDLKTSFGVPFLLAVLSTLDKHHRFFQKSFVPAPRKTKKKPPPPIRLPPGFLDGQPAPTKNMVKHASSRLTNKLSRFQFGQ